MLIALVMAAYPRANAQNSVSQKEAVKVAVNYINGYLGGNGTCTVNDLAYYSTETKSSVTLLHEVHIGGYKLILSGVKSCKPVLMYVKDSTASLLLDDNDESGVSYFLNRYCNEIMYAIDSSQNKDTILEDWGILLSNDAPLPTKEDVIIGPFLTTSWGQRVPNSGGNANAYNYYVSTVCTDCSGNVSPTGCIATALGQIMNYWKHPVYRDTSIIQFDWCNMADKLDEGEPNYEIKRNAVAQLLSEVGLATDMNYCFGGCQAFAWPSKAESAMKNDFGYSNDAELRWRAAHINVWKNMLVGEIAQGRPVFYSALAKHHLLHGHAFVIHGYNSSTDKFCVNFGHLENEAWTTIDEIGFESKYDYTNLENAIFGLTPENQMDYCDFDLNLSEHYQSYYPNDDYDPEPYLCVPQTATTLTSSDISSPSSWRTIPTGASSEYVAHKTVVIQPGFHAEKGSEFVAKIVPCPNCDNRNLDLSDGRDVADNDAGYDDSAKGEKGAMFEDKDMESVFKDGERLFPNPSKDRIIYRGKEVNRVFVYDMAGKPVFRWFIVSKTDDEVTIDIKNIEAGTYLLYVVNNDSSRSAYKFVKK